VSTESNTEVAESSAPPQLRRGATSLWLIRHAEVEARYQGVFGGRVDMDLSPLGMRQAEMLAGYLRKRPFDAIYASPMKRVRQTLAPLQSHGAPQPSFLAGLREVDFGDWTGFRWEEIEPKFGVSAYAWLEQIERGAIANAENAEALEARVDACLQQILASHAGQRVAVACHGGVIRVLLSILLDWPLSRMAAFEVDYASVTQVSLSSNGSCLQMLNFAPWREITP
jgi:broad specificity phosphatase PhoE